MRRLRPSLAIFFGFIALVLAFTLTMPKSYTTTVKLIAGNSGSNLNAAGTSAGAFRAAEQRHPGAQRVDRSFRRAERRNVRRAVSGNAGGRTSREHPGPSRLAGDTAEPRASAARTEHINHRFVCNVVRPADVGKNREQTRRRRRRPRAEAGCRPGRRCPGVPQQAAASGTEGDESRARTACRLRGGTSHRRYQCADAIDDAVR